MQAENRPIQKLLQTLPSVESDISNIEKNIKNIAKGIGSQWANYPRYIYRVPVGKSHDSQSKANKYQAMAQYAAELYDYGHEIQALYAYQQLLQQQPQIFTEHPSHLFRLAETHLGQGNLTLAKGYYNTLLEMNKSHDLAEYARLRILDIKLIEAQQNTNTAPPTLTELEAIDARQNPELQAHIQIRKAYWNSKNIKQHQNNKDYLPPLEVENRVDLESIRSKIKYIRTAFLVDTLLFQDKINNPDLWDPSAIQLATSYFERYGGKASEPFRTQFAEKTTNIIREQIQKRVEQKKYESALDLYNSLPSNLKAILDDAETAWLLGQSFPSYSSI